MRTTPIYSKGYIVDYDEGDFSLQRSTVKHIDDIEDKAYTIIEGDELTSISFRFYGVPTYWYIIADVNNILNPFDLTVGDNIIIPNLNKYDL